MSPFLLLTLYLSTPNNPECLVHLRVQMLLLSLCLWAGTLYGAAIAVSLRI